MKHLLLSLSLLAVSGIQIHAMDDDKENRNPLVEPLLIEPLENWAYEDLGLDGLLERIGEDKFFALRKTSEQQIEALNVHTESLTEVDSKTCEAFALNRDKNGADTIFQIRFKHRDMIIDARHPVRASINDYSSIMHHKDIRDPNTSYALLTALINAAKEQKNNSSAGEIRKS